MSKTTYAGWVNLQTLQSKEMISELLDAKDHQRAKLLISDTGLGKSRSIEIFKKQLPDYTFVIVAGDSFKLVDVLNALLLKMGIHRWDVKTNIYEKLSLIKEKIETYKKEDKKCKPIIIIDEAENLKPSVLKMLKELYDAIHEQCSIVMIGTDQILDALLNRKGKNRQSVPQLWRRFKAGTRYISPLNKARDFRPFFDRHIPDNMDLQDLLNEVAENYGELHDYMDPYLRFAAGKGITPDEKTFRLFHKIPKQPIGKVRKLA